MKVRYTRSWNDKINQERLTIGKVYKVTEVDEDGAYWVLDNGGEEFFLFPSEVEVIEDEGYPETPQKDEHYNNENGSLYLFAQHHDLNAWEFEVIKRIVRCRKKGEFISDIDKTKRVLDLYLKEQGELYKNQVEVLNNK